MAEQELYYYCSVLPVGFSSPYFYINDSGPLAKGTRVEVPFGAENELRKGTVVNCAPFSEEDAPFPLANTKRIRRTLSEEEFFAGNYDFKLEFHEGIDYSEDLRKVKKYIKKRKYDAMYSWASRHHDCVDSPEVLEKVLECYELCVEQNMPAAALNLGTMYYMGRVVNQDFEKAAHYYKIAADAGLLRAICNLGYCYYYGRHQDVDYKKAYEYFLKGALLHNDVNCLYKLGDMYLNGYAVEKNPAYAFMLYERAWDIASDFNKENDYCRPDVQFRMGKCYLKGIGTPVILTIALKHLTQALCGFYDRLKTDPFVKGMIEGTKELIEEAARKLEE